MTITDTVPTIETAKRTDKNRSVEFVWSLGEVERDLGEGKRDSQAVLRIAHHKAGINYFTYEQTTEDHFTVSVSRQYAEKRDGYSMVGFTVGNGIGIGRIPAGHRYSAKKLREAVEEGVRIFEECKHDPRVARYFDKDEDPSLRDRR